MKKPYIINSELKTGCKSNYIWYNKIILPKRASNELKHTSLWLNPQVGVLKVELSYRYEYKRYFDRLIENKVEPDNNARTSTIGQLWRMNALASRGGGTEGFWFLFNFKEEHIEGKQIDRCLDLIKIFNIF